MLLVIGAGAGAQTAFANPPAKTFAAQLNVQGDCEATVTMQWDGIRLTTVGPVVIVNANTGTTSAPQSHSETGIRSGSDAVLFQLNHAASPQTLEARVTYAVGKKTHQITTTSVAGSLCTP